MKVVYYDVWDEEATKYSLLIIEDPSFLDIYGGRYLVTVLVGSYGTTYFYNLGYKHPSYLKQKHPNLTYRDAEIIAKRLNKILK